MKPINYLLLLILFSAKSVSAEVLFEENFDGLPDWRTADRSTVGALPGTFNYGYTAETYHPSSGYTNSLPSMYISGNDKSQVFGGKGKAFIATYETRSTTNKWISDGFLAKDIPPSNEVYVSFKVKFQPGFNKNDVGGMVKLLRILSWDGVEPRSKFFSTGNSAPIYLFDWEKTSYGIRQKHAFRCDDQATTYYCVKPEILNPPRSITSGAMSANFTNNVANLTTKIPDLVKGGYLPSKGIVSHAQVFGDIWHSMEFYVKLNSNPSVQDGVLKVWLDGQPIIDMNGIPWIGSNGNMNAKWNNVAFGGNGFYFWDTSTSDFNPSKERWVAFDDILIMNSMPNRPNPPSDVTVK